jgi:large subunit ribosomal protein L23
MKTIVQRPVITEKSLFLASKGWYTFAVSADARKEEIVKDLKQAYNVDVVAIRTHIMPGKAKRVGKKMVQIQKPDWKKSVVQLKPGQKLDMFEVTPQQTQE